MIRRIIESTKGNLMDELTSVPVKLPVTPELVMELVPKAETAKVVTDNLMSALNDQADNSRRYYEKLSKQIKQIANTKEAAITQGDNNMAEVMTPGMIMGMGGNNGGDLFGGGGGLVGGLILGSLLRQGNGGIFGGNGDGASAVLRSPPEQSQANMSLMQAIGAVDKSVAVNAATFEASQATQSLGLTGQFNNAVSALAARIEGIKDIANSNNIALMQGQNAIQQNIMENRYELSKDISNDGEKTRALITQQYEINLQRQLSDANAAIIELRSRAAVDSAASSVTLTNTNNINQMQQQSQQQSQYAQLAHLIYGLSQNITNANSAINVGSGTQTSTPTNTNTNIR